MDARRTILATLGALAALPAFADHEPLGPIQPSADEQLGIYEINRARSDPPAYGEKIGLDLSLIAAQPPLAVSPHLSGSARFHAQVMLDHHEFSHVSATLGIGPNQMAVDHGYDLFLSGLSRDWGTANNIESILRSVNQIATTPAAVKTLVIDKDVPGVGHRVHLLAIGAYTNHREIGFGWATGTDSFPEFGLSRPLPTRTAAIHTGYRDASEAFLTGVVFADRNGNLRYDKGEGLEGVTVSVDGGGSTITMKQGGWALPAAAGARIVRCAGGAFVRPAAAFATVGGANVEVDFHSGRPVGEVGFAWRDGAVPPGPEVAIDTSADSGTAPLAVTLTGSGLSGGLYAWDLGNDETAEGTVAQATYLAPGLYPVVLDGLDASGAGSALRLVVVGAADGAGPGTSAPVDSSLRLTRGLAKRKLKKPGKDSVKLTAALELPAGLRPERLVVSASVAGATRTFTLDAKGRAKLDDKSKIVLKAPWPKDGSGVPAGTVAKLTVLVKGDLARELEAAGLRNRTETRAVPGVPCAVLLGGQPYRSLGTMATKAKSGKSAKGTITASD